MTRYELDACTIDTDTMRVAVDGRDVPVQPQVFDVLALLIAERHRVVTKQELLERVWGHTFVTESTLTSRIKSARQAIGDDGRSQRLIRTVHGRGYQFVGEVRQSRASAGTAQPQTADRVGGERSSDPIGRHRLPSFGSRLVGRDADVDRILELLDANRLVTIVGPEKSRPFEVLTTICGLSAHKPPLITSTM